MGPKRLRRGLAIIAGAVIAFVLALLFIPSSYFPLKSRLEEQELLIPAISFLSIVAASFIGGLILAAVNEKIQTYSWKRDQALMDIKDVYMPLYHDVADIARYTSDFRYPNWVVESWQAINRLPLGARLQIMEPKFYDRLSQLFEDFENYRQAILAAYEMVKVVAREVIEKQLDESITVKDEILADMPETLDYYGYLYSGFLRGKSVREWSILEASNEQFYLEGVYKALEKEKYWKHLALSMEEIEEILDEIYHKVQADTAIKEKVSWCEGYKQRAIRLKKELEEHIIRPQLP